MKPVYKIIADSQDITNKLQGRVISLTINDEVGLVSDSLSLEIDDREHIFEIPKSGAELEVFMGYEGQQLYSMGKFMVDEIELSGPPDKIMITGRSANSNIKDDVGTFKAPVNFSWDQISLLDIVQTIASKYNLEELIDSRFGDIFIDHIDQTDESDSSFIQRLAKDYGGIVKVAGGKLLFIEPTKGVFPDGTPLPTIKIDYKDITNYRMRISERGKYKKVVAKYYDFNLATEEKVEVGEENPTFSIRETFTDLVKAQMNAESKLQDDLRGTYSLSMEMTGDPVVSAESKIEIIGIRKALQEAWIIQKASHRLNSSGFKTSIEACRPITEKTEKEDL